MQHNDAAWFHKEVIACLNPSALPPFLVDGCPSARIKQLIKEWFAKWFDYSSDVDEEMEQYGDFEENEEHLCYLYNAYFAPYVVDNKAGLFVIRYCFDFIGNQRKAARLVFKNISNLPYSGALQLLDGYPKTKWKTRQEAREFFQVSLMPFAKNTLEEQEFWTWFEKHMTFDDEQREAKKSKV